MSKEFVLALAGDEIEPEHAMIVGCVKSDILEAAKAVGNGECIKAIEVVDHARAVEAFGNEAADMHLGEGVYNRDAVDLLSRVGDDDATDKVNAIISGRKAKPAKAGAAPKAAPKTAAKESAESKTRAAKKDGTERAVRTKKMGTVEMFEEGLLVEGQPLWIKENRTERRPGSKAKVKDGKMVVFGGKTMAYNAWVESVTGSRGAATYKYALTEDGRTLEQVRSGVTAEDLQEAAAKKAERKAAPKTKAKAGKAPKEAPKAAKAAKEIPVSRGPCRDGGRAGGGIRHR